MKVRRVDFYPDDWLSGTLELNDLDRGVYITICALIYARGSTITIELLKRHCHSHGNALAASLTRLSEARKIVRTGPEIGQKRCRNELERAEKRLRNASENGTKGNEIKKVIAATRSDVANANNQQPTTNIYSEEDKSSSDAGASSDHDPVKEIFDRGVAILGRNRRALLGKMAKQYGQVAVLAAIVATEQAAPIDPVSYFVKACEQRQTNGHSSQKHGPLTTLWEGAFNAARKWEEAHGDSGDRSLPYEPLLDIRRVDGTA